MFVFLSFRRTSFSPPVNGFRVQEAKAVDTTTVEAVKNVVDPVTGKVLIYDVTKVVHHDSLMSGKSEEYSLHAEEIFLYYREREVSSA